CFDCHEAKEPEGKLVLESFDTVMKGGESGAVIVPGKSAESLLLKLVDGGIERDGKKIIMPPGKRKKLTPEEIATIKSWIDSGAKKPEGVRARELVLPKISPKVTPRKPINAAAYAAKVIALARYGEVELISHETRLSLRTLSGHRGNVNAVVFSADGDRLFAAAGENALFGEVREWNVADGKLVRKWEAHRDAIYGLALSPDGKTLATGSYDQKIKLWKVESGDEIRTLSGHNGCVFDLAFRPDGKLLASASADRTVKLWDVATGERRDTLSQSLKELYALAFAPDGKRLVAGGVDNRIRLWEISESAAETTNPLLYSRFAHEGAILNLAFSADGKTLASSADDRSVKLWDAAEIKERAALEKQADWPQAIAFLSQSKSLLVGRLDGSMEFYDVTSGKVVLPAKPELVRTEPRGIQRGVETRLKLIGSNLLTLKEIHLHNPKLTGALLKDPAPKAEEAWIQLSAAADLPRGPYEISVVGAGGESGTIKIHVDSLPQVSERETNLIKSLPMNIWGTLDPMGDSDIVQFSANAGQSLVFDVTAKTIGSKANAVLTLFDAQGKVLASNNDFDKGDPLLLHTFAEAGHYTIQVSELTLGASADHFYRLSIGEFPYVTGVYPLSVSTNRDAEVELIGFNLPAEQKVKIKPEKTGELEVPIDLEKFRNRRALKVLVTDMTELVEAEPNGTPSTATKMTLPCAVAGRISTKEDVDVFGFEARAGQRLIIETSAAQRGSPVDTKIEVLHADGKPVERVMLQAVRNSAITFRGINSDTPDCRVENWEEMELNELLYLNGELVKLFRAPQGPDSGFLFYSLNGKRHCYFDTSGTAHALDEPCYIVEPHPPGTKLVANGLPAFTLYYANDDDGDRKLGTDSRVHFTAPNDGQYRIRVTDTRGYFGDRFAYRLVVREAKPDFKVTLNGANPTVNAGSGQSFSVSAERLDGFDEDINVEINDLPPGFSVSTPLVIQAGHIEAKGTINAAPDAPKPTNAMTRVTATAMIDGKAVKKDVNNLGTIKLTNKPKLFVSLEPASAANPDLTIAPGQTIPALLKIQRNGHEDLVTFTVENLPHGVIVDNIGLNGVLIPKGQNEREIFLTAAKWVPETDRLCYAVENQVGKQTSLPVMLHVRKGGHNKAVTAAK
ncbi:MAG TPA: c-type cytochrome domain-containing protein, partial [Verrucomicrobiae bacterium]|nr:c-type cytochrome domain-containing protein [Verrucomicrobiae bacterium]